MADMAQRIGLRPTTLTDRFPPPGGRYTATAQALHWIVAVLFVAQVVIAWTLVVRADGDPGDAILLVMPISGYLSSAAAGHTIHYFWLFDLPNLPQSKELAHNAIVVHVIGQWFIYAAVVLHLSGTAWNLVVRRDGSLNRMLPEQSEA